MSNQQDFERIYQQNTADDVYDSELGVYTEAPKKKKRDIADVRRASFGQRFGAYIVDYLILFIFQIMARVISFIVFDGSGGLSQSLAYVAWGAYLVVMPVRTQGQTLGKQLIGIRIVNTDGSALTYTNLIMRHVFGYWLSGMFFYLGFLWMLWDDNNQTWHDKVARTMVIND